MTVGLRGRTGGVPLSRSQEAIIHRFRGPAVGALVLLLAVGSLWYAVLAPRSSSAYTHQASQTAARLRSQVRTAQLWAQQLDRGNAPDTTVRVGLEELDSDASLGMLRFSAAEPPPGTDRVRSRLTDLGQRALSALDGLRIAARRGDTPEVVRLATALSPIGDDLDRLATELGR